MHTKEISSTATLAWGPSSGKSTYLVAGTLAGAMDASFSTNAELEVWDLNEKSSEPSVRLGSIPSSSRFNRLAWSPLEKHGADGVIIGGMEDGGLGFWSASKIIQKASPAECQIDLKTDAHTGPVKGLEVNPLQPFLVASGSVDAQIMLWDLNNLAEGFAPSQNKSSRLEDITDLAWNKKVAHILATASSNGYTVVWDLKVRKEVMQLAMPGGRRSVSAIAWDPENPTHILTATDDDSSPVIYSWDLRNAHAPNMTLQGHTKGILSMSWCPKDSELLLSSGKDNRTLCWNPQTGALISEISRSTNWIFDTQWCPRNPDIFSSASFDGRIAVNSFQALSTGHAQPSSAPGKAEDFFSAPSAGEPAAKGTGARQIPKWLKRPIGATFGFGGRMVVFSEAAPKRVTVIPVIAKQAPAFATESLKLDSALSRNTFPEFCASKISHGVSSLHEKDPEAVFWSVVKVLVEAEPQRKLMDLLGFDRAHFAKQVQALHLKDLPPVAAEVVEEEEEAGRSHPTSPLNFGDTGDEGAAVFDQLSLTALPSGQATPSKEASRRGSIPFRLFGPESTETDRVITRAVIMGDFQTAVDICIKSNRLPDALLVAICGGPELLARTQEIYLQRAECPYLRVVGAIIKRDLTDVVACGDLGNWEELLGLVCSFAEPGDFARLCRILGSRLEEESPATPSYVMPAIICNMAAGNAQHAASLVIRLEESKLKQSASYEEYGAWLESLVEKVRSVEKASAVHGQFEPMQASVPGLSAKYLAYSVLMAEQGLLEIAARYYGCLGKAEYEGEDVGAAFGERLWNAVKGLNVTVPRTTPFSIVNVVPEAASKAAAVGTQAVPQQALPQFGQPQQMQQQQQPWAQPTAPSAPTAFSQPAAYQPQAAPQQPQQAPAATPFGWNPPAAPAPMAPVAQAPLAMPPMPSFPPAVPSMPPFQPAPSMPAAAPMASAFATAPAPVAPQQFTPAGFNQPYGQQFSPTDMQPMQRAPAVPAVPSIPQPGVSFVGGSGSFSAGTLPHGQVSPLNSPAAAPVPPKPIGGFNDAPMIAPRAPLAPAPAPIQVPSFQPTPQLPPQAIPQQQAPPSVVAASMASPTQPQATSPRALGPVDPSTIPAASQPIYQTFSQLIAFCQARAVPVQRRIIEDSVKRLQFLFHQLAAGELSPLVHGEMEKMCQLISQRNLDAALALHLPLMTAHFTEVGQWILAVKRLIEVAKTCPQ